MIILSLLAAIQFNLKQGICDGKRKQVELIEKWVNAKSGGSYSLHYSYHSWWMCTLCPSELPTQASGRMLTKAHSTTIYMELEEIVATKVQMLPTEI
jgi:hypothetical protein